MTQVASHPALERFSPEEPGEEPACDVATAMERIVSTLLSYRPQADSDLVRRAFDFANQKHTHEFKQFRVSGEPYIIHPVEVTEILSELQLDEQTLAAALLHDVIEDCKVTVEELTQKFGLEVAHLVDGVTKLRKNR